MPDIVKGDTVVVQMGGRRAEGVVALVRPDGKLTIKLEWKDAEGHVRRRRLVRSPAFVERKP